MDLHLTAKTALITGASMGIGAHVAETLAAEGVHLHLTARSAKKLETLKAKIAKNFRCFRDPAPFGFDI